MMTAPFFVGELMPIYTFRNNETNEEFEETMKISEMEIFLKDNPHIKHVFKNAPAIGDSVRLGIRRIDSSFNDVLQKAKNAHKYSTVNTR
jgi:hypothetical protein